MMNGYYIPNVGSIQTKANNNVEEVSSFNDDEIFSFSLSSSQLSDVSHSNHSRRNLSGDLYNNREAMSTPRKDDDVEPDFIHHVTHNEAAMKLNFYTINDSAREIKSSSFTDSDTYFSKVMDLAHIIMYVYDVTDMSSFEAITSYYEQYMSCCSKKTEEAKSLEESLSPLGSSPSSLVPSLLSRLNASKPSLVVGLKTDLEEDRAVSESDIYSHRRIMTEIPFYECSCINGDNVLTLFEDIKQRSFVIMRNGTPTIDSGRRHRPKLSVSSNSNPQTPSTPSPSNRERERRGSKIMDSVKRASIRFTSRLRSNTLASTPTLESSEKVVVQSHSSSSPSISNNRRSQSIGSFILGHQKTASGSPSSQEQTSELKQPVRSRPTTWSMKGLFKKK